MAAPGDDADIILVGGGLANTLIALRLRAVRPELRLLIVERGATLGGNHTWSFHSPDLTAEQLARMKPLIGSAWPDQEVRFPGRRRILPTGYNSVASERLHAHGAATLVGALRLGVEVADVSPQVVTLAGGESLRAPCVIDGRGALRDQPLALGYQKFVGLEIETVDPHGVARPIIMDATVDQADGYRFVYTLPFSPTRLMIEDTFYSDVPQLDVARLTANAERYAAAQGFGIARIVRRETGVLPITLAGDIDLHWRQMGAELPRSGLRAWLFHATTGYSLPYAVRLADEIAAVPELVSRAVAQRIERVSRAAWEEQSFFRLLNRLLFLAAEPDQRRGVLARFYELPEALIERFYAARLTRADKARILTGRPPVPLFKAVQCFDEGRAWTFAARHRSPTAALG